MTNRGSILRMIGRFMMRWDISGFNPAVRGLWQPNAN